MAEPAKMLLSVLKRICRIKGHVVAGLLAASIARAAQAEVYQWSAPVAGYVSAESKGAARAYLWIPEQCSRVRAVVIAVQNMQEEQVFKNADFRKTLADLNFALIWIAPPLGNGTFRPEEGQGNLLQSTLTTLAENSGYSEIRHAPLVPLGHSASAGWGWDLAAWNPERVLAVVSLSGQWPYALADYRKGKNFDGVPGLTTKGEFEIGGDLEKGWYAGLKGDFYAAHPNAAFSQVVEPGDDHFGASTEKIALVNLYLRKAAQYRLPAQSSSDEPVKLKPIDAAKMGWRYEVWKLDTPPEAPAAPVGQFKGKFERSFWTFDEEMARAMEKFQSTQRNKKNVLLAYRQANGFTTPNPNHIQVNLKFEPVDDGMTFKLTGGFWDTVPATKDGKPAGWQNTLGEGKRQVQQGEPIEHPAGEEDRITIAPICGPVAQLSKDTFAIRFNRTGFDNPKRCSSFCLEMTYPGNDQFKRQVQRAELKFPLKNTRGAEQTLTFPKLNDVTFAGGLKPIQLAATSSAGAKVYYYVREGPAEVDDNGLLTWTAIPPRAKFPMAVTVVAWQWGRATEPRLQTAAPIEQTFLISAP